MARYIDANDFKREMEKYLPDDRELALKVLKSIKTADVVEVVRCKDCGIRMKDGYCPNGRFTPCDDWFCAEGERRKEAEHGEIHY